MTGHDQPCRCSECRGEPRDADSLIAREYKRPALFRPAAVIDGGDLDEDPFVVEWRRRLEALELASPLDRKARDTVLAGDRAGVRDLAKRAGCSHPTALKRLQRAERLGWLVLHEEPMKAAEYTLPRTWSRKVFWTDDWWNYGATEPAAWAA